MQWMIFPAPEVVPVIVYEQLDEKVLLVHSKKAQTIAAHLLLHSSLCAPTRDGPSGQQPLQEAASYFGPVLAFVASDSRLLPARRVVGRA